MDEPRSLRQKLLSATLENAAKIPFYGEFWAGIPLGDIRTIGDLTGLPLLSKAHYRSSLMFAENCLGETAFVTHTSGTTGELTWRHRSVGEASIIQELFGLANADSDSIEDPPLSLVLQYGRHGNAMPMPGKARAFPIAMSDDTELAQALAALDGDFHYGGKLGRPVSLCGGVQHLSLLAQAWIERGLKREPSPIRTLQVLGYTDPGLCAFLMDAFDSPALLENFSMAEIFGGAQRLWPNRFFSLDPYVIGEVVDENSLAVGEGEIGELILSELFPFVQMQPLIRYRTGDIVKLIRRDADDTLHFEWHGRRRDCILQTTGSTSVWGLTFRPICDWLSTQPLAAREERLGQLDIHSRDFGTPCLGIFRDAETGQICVDIGLRINPWASKEATHQFVGMLWQLLREIAHDDIREIPVRISLVDGRGTPDFAQTLDRPRLRFHATPLWCSSPLP